MLFDTFGTGNDTDIFWDDQILAKIPQKIEGAFFRAILQKGKLRPLSNDEMRKRDRLSFL